MVDGSLARFLVFQTDDDVPDRNKHPKPVGDVPADLIDALQAIAAGVPGHGRGDLAALVEGPMIVPDPCPVPMAPEACDRVPGGGVSTDPSNVKNPSIERFERPNVMKYRVFLVPDEIFQSFNPKTHTDTSTAGREWPRDLCERLKD